MSDLPSRSLAPGDVPGFLAKTDVFLFPSQFEGCPNALMQALACDTAVVSTDCVGGSASCRYLRRQLTKDPQILWLHEISRPLVTQNPPL